MKSLKEVVVFSPGGDPREIKTWSNVPYFLVHTLESKNIKVHTVDIGPQSFFHKAFKKTFNTVVKLLFKDTFYDYTRTPLYYQIMRYKIKKSLKAFENADALIFTTFGVSAIGLTAIPSILFCDWTMDHHINYYFNREPDKYETATIVRENNTIEQASGVFVLFPAVAKIMQHKYDNPNIFYNGNVINSALVPDAAIIQSKEKETNLLFVGKQTYKQGAVELLKAFNKLKIKIPGLRLDIIGLNAADFDDLPKDVICHGYLDKGIESDAKKYYELLSKAKVFINTTPKWGAFSASLEAMYFYTPLIITAYTEFVTTFGETIDFGIYHSPDASLIDSISEILNADKYEDLCLNAHHAAREFTWDKYVDNMVNTTSQLL